jgi:hypothetical protein
MTTERARSVDECGRIFGIAGVALVTPIAAIDPLSGTFAEISVIMKYVTVSYCPKALQSRGFDIAEVPRSKGICLEELASRVRLSQYDAVTYFHRADFRFL